MNAGREPDLHVSHASCTASLYTKGQELRIYTSLYNTRIGAKAPHVPPPGLASKIIVFFITSSFCALLPT